VVSVATRRTASWLLLAAIAACGPRPPAPVSLRHAAACDAAAAALRDWQQSVDAGRLFDALDAARRADTACASPASRQAIAEALDALADDARAADAWRAYAATPGSDPGFARDRLAALARRPPARRDASPDDRATALLLYRDGVDLRLRGEPDRAITQLRRSYALSPHPLTIVQIGLAHQAAGRGADAQASFDRALAIAEATRGVAAQPRLTPRHAGEISALAFDGGGAVMASGGQDGQVMLWDTATGRLVRRLVVGDDPARVVALRFSADRTRVAAVSAEGFLHVWGAVTGAVAIATRLPAEPASGAGPLFALLPGLDRVVIADQERRLSVVGSDGAVLATTTAPGAIDRLALSGDGRRVAVVTDEQIAVLATADLLPVRALPRDGDLGELSAEVALTGDGAALLVDRVTDDGYRVTRVDLSTGRAAGVVARADMPLGDDALLLAPGDRRLASLGTGEVELWDTATRRRVRRLGDDGMQLTAAAFHPDGDLLACGDSEGTLRLFEAASGRVVRVLGFDTWGINDVGFDAAGDRLALASDHGAIQIWDIDGTGKRRQLRGHWGWVVFSQFDRGGDRLISGGKDQTIRIWNAGSGVQERVARARVVGKGNQAFAVASGPRGVVVASMVAGFHPRGWGLEIIDPVTGKRRPGYAAFDLDDDDDDDAHRQPRVVALDGGGYRAAVGFADGTAQLFDLVARRPGPVVAAHGAPLTAIAFAGGRLATTSTNPGEGIRVWRIAGTNVTREIDLPGHTDDHAVELLFLPGDRLVSVGRDHRVIIWDLASRQALHTLVHDDVVTGVTLSPDGRTLATSSKDRTVRLWDAASGAPVGTLLPTRGGDWLVVAADGRVDGTPDGAALLYWQVGDVELPGFVAWERQGRPGLLRQLLRR